VPNLFRWGWEAGKKSAQGKSAKPLSKTQELLTGAGLFLILLFLVAVPLGGLLGLIGDGSPRSRVIGLLVLSYLAFSGWRAWKENKKPG
jgi:threonine/homoserine/homoserine lactone efflux protein